jgi:hypothetical protein
MGGWGERNLGTQNWKTSVTVLLWEEGYSAITIHSDSVSVLKPNFYALVPILEGPDVRVGRRRTYGVYFKRVSFAWYQAYFCT